MQKPTLGDLCFLSKGWKYGKGIFIYYYVKQCYLCWYDLTGGITLLFLFVISVTINTDSNESQVC